MNLNVNRCSGLIVTCKLGHYSIWTGRFCILFCLHWCLGSFSYCRKLNNNRCLFITYINKCAILEMPTLRTVPEIFCAVPSCVHILEPRLSRAMQNLKRRKLISQYDGISSATAAKRKCSSSLLRNGMLLSMPSRNYERL